MRGKSREPEIFEHVQGQAGETHRTPCEGSAWDGLMECFVDDWFPQQKLDALGFGWLRKVNLSNHFS